MNFGLDCAAVGKIIEVAQFYLLINLFSSRALLFSYISELNGSVNSKRAHPPGHLLGSCHFYFLVEKLEMRHGGAGRLIHKPQWGQPQDNLKIAFSSAIFVGNV